MDELSWYIEPTFVEDDIVFKAGWWEFSSTVDGEKDEVAVYFYFDSDKNLLKAFFCNYGEYEQADEEFLTQFDWDSMLETYYWEPYYGGDNHIIDQYLRKVSEEGLPDFIKNSI